MYATGSAAAVGGTAGVLASTGYNMSTVLIVSAALTVVLGILLLVRSFRRRNAPTS
jgi:LPXTG-motif cell wall-anchored protein